MALMTGYVFVSCDEEKLTPEEENKPVVPQDSVPGDSVQTPADTIAYTLSMTLPQADSTIWQQEASYTATVIYRRTLQSVSSF